MRSGEGAEAGHECDRRGRGAEVAGICDPGSDQRRSAGEPSRQKTRYGPRFSETVLTDRAGTVAEGYRWREARRRVRERGEACDLSVELSEHHG